MTYILKDKNLGVLFSIVFLFFLNETMLFPTLPLYFSGIGYSNTQIGLTLGAFALGVLTFRTISGRLTDEKGRKVSLALGLFIFAIAPVFYFFSTNFIYILIIRFIHGIGITFFTTGYPSMVSDIAPASQRGEIMGHMGIASSVSVAIGPMTGTALYNALGMGSVFFSCIFLGVMSLVMLIFISETAPVDSNKASEPILFSHLLKRRIILVTSGVALIMSVINGSVITYLPIMIMEETPLNTSVYFAIMSVMMIGFRLFSSKLSDRYGRGPCFFYSFLCMILGTMMVSKIDSMATLTLAASLHGIGIALALPSLMALITDYTEKRVRGSVFSIFFGAYDIGMILAGVILGSLSDYLGFRNMYLLCAGLGMMAAITFALTIRPDVLKSLIWTTRGERGVLCHSPHLKK